MNYNGGEIRTAVGDFIGSGTPQIAAAQGIGGSGVIRLFQYTGLSKPNAWKVVGQFYGLPSNLVEQIMPVDLLIPIFGMKTYSPGNTSVSLQAEGDKTTIGLSIAAGDMDGDGRDELIVGQSNGPTSQTSFHVLDINNEGGIGARHPYAGFISKYRG